MRLRESERERTIRAPYLETHAFKLHDLDVIRPQEIFFLKKKRGGHIQRADPLVFSREQTNCLLHPRA